MISLKQKRKGIWFETAILNGIKGQIIRNLSWKWKAVKPNEWKKLAVLLSYATLGTQTRLLCKSGDTFTVFIQPSDSNLF
jgi:hypothetical protein